MKSKKNVLGVFIKNFEIHTKHSGVSDEVQKKSNGNFLSICVGSNSFFFNFFKEGNLKKVREILMCTFFSS